MSALTYYIHANIYILIFGLFFHLVLRKETFFRGQRIYILCSIMLSVLLPLSAMYLKPSSVIYTYNPINLAAVNDFNIVQSIVAPVSASNFSWIEVFKSITIGGSVFTLLFHVYNHTRIYAFINNKNYTSYGKLRVFTSSKNITPFLYHRNIVVPSTLSHQERDITIKHEYQHYKLGHGIDTILFQVIQLVFWFNPVVHLLKSELKEIHEFQVDQKLLESDMDASIYQLLLIKFSVGCQKFAVANGLSNNKIKNRITMMNVEKTVCWKWKYVLSIPALLVIFTVVSFSQSNNNCSPIKTAIDSKGMRHTSKITIELIENKKVRLNDEVISIEDISDRIIALKANNVIGKDYEYIVQIKAPGNTKMETITSIKQELREARILKVNLTYK